MKLNQELRNYGFGDEGGVYGLGLGDLYSFENEGTVQGLAAAATSQQAQVAYPGLSPVGRAQLMRYLQLGNVDRASWSLVEESFRHKLQLNTSGTTGVPTKKTFFNVSRQDFVCNLENGRIEQTDTIGIVWNIAISPIYGSVNASTGEIGYNTTNLHFTDAEAKAFNDTLTHIIEHGELEIKQNNKRLIRRKLSHFPSGAGVVRSFGTTQTADQNIFVGTNGMIDPRHRMRMQTPILLLPAAPITAVFEMPAGCPALPASANIGLEVELIGHQIEPGGIGR